jgi:uncharacterized protein YecT (DUF1311 family)
MKKLAFASIALLGFSINVLADCEDMKEGSTAASACFRAREYDDLDKKLNESYNFLVKVFKKYNLPKNKEMLLKAEQAWLKFRDKQCDLENEVYGGIESISQISCMGRLTSERESELRHMLEAYDIRDLK